MAIYYKNKDFILKEGDRDFDLPEDEVATQEEMEEYVLNMTPAAISEDGRDLIIEFEPFPNKYINYIRQRQYKGMRTQVFWQLIRYVGKKNWRQAGFISNPGELHNWRTEDSSLDIYHWTFPLRWNADPYGAPGPYQTRKPFIFNISPQEAFKGEIIWKEGAAVIRSFDNRPFGVRNECWPKEIAAIFGVANQGMKNPFIYKKSESYYYDNEWLGPPLPDEITIEDESIIPDLLYEVDIKLTQSDDDYFVSFENVHEDLKNYAEKYQENHNKGLFIQSLFYFGGMHSGRKDIRRSSKTHEAKKFLSKSDLENGFFLKEQKFIVKQEADTWEERDFLTGPVHNARYKYEEVTFYHYSILLVLANPGMNDGWDISKESNIINLLEQ